MAKSKTRGWYTFEDGARVWFYRLSGNEKKMEMMRHGKIVSFTPTN